MGLSEAVLKAIRRKGYRLPTPIQRKTLPLILQGLDVVGMARTGSGKTAAFVVPLVERLGAHCARAGARAVVLSPTRELALQTHKVVKELGRHTDLRTAGTRGVVLRGGACCVCEGGGRTGAFEWWRWMFGCRCCLLGAPCLRLRHPLTPCPAFLCSWLQCWWEVTPWRRSLLSWRRSQTSSSPRRVGGCGSGLWDVVRRGCAGQQDGSACV